MTYAILQKPKSIFFLQFPDKKGFIREETESTSIMSHACFEPKNSVVNLNHKM